MRERRIVWNRMCHVDTVGDPYLKTEIDLAVTTDGEKFGLQYNGHEYDRDRDEKRHYGYQVVKEKYDVLYNYEMFGMPSGFFFAYSGGKCGAFEIRSFYGDDSIVDYLEVLPFQFDSITETRHSDVILCRQGNDTKYCNLQLRYVSPAYDRIWVDHGYLICECNAADEKRVIRVYDNKTVYVGPKCGDLYFLCYYKNGAVFVDNPTGGIRGEEAYECIEDARLCFLSEGKMMYTKVYRKLKAHIIQSARFEFLMGFETTKGKKTKKLSAKKTLFSNRDLKRLGIIVSEEQL